MRAILTVSVILSMFMTCQADTTDDYPTPRKLWDMQRLCRTPKTFDPPDFFTEEYLQQMRKRNVHPIWFEGEPYKGKPTRVFAWYGVPTVKKGQKLPAMVLVHGGGGTSDHNWVQHWMKRGYAAISMDHCSHLPIKGPEHIRNSKGRVLRRRTEYSGPPPYGFDGMDEPLRDQWPYHAVSSVILAHSLIRSFAEIDTDKIGLQGVSWGGYLACFVAGLDNRFRCAVSVYGCGFLHERSVWSERELGKLSKPHRHKWATLWDPSHSLANVRIPMLWVTGTNDFAYWMPSLRKSYMQVKVPAKLCVRVRMKHDHAGGWTPKETHIFTDSHLKSKTPLATILRQGRSAKVAWVTFDSPVKVLKVEFNYTTDTGRWPSRKWKTLPAQLDDKKNLAKVNIPERVAAYYFNVFDERDCVISSSYVDPPKK